jgi:TolB-like protein/DNA-binding winged helix-turn-helix (wHTH) protein
MISEQVETPFRIVRFGLFEVDLEACELRKKGVRIKLQDQPLHILRVLIEHPGEIVSREELRHRLWQPDTFVDFDHSLNTAMMRLREVLGDSSENPRFIETVPRKGYRFVAPVHQIRPETPADFAGTQEANQAPPPPGTGSNGLYPIAGDEVTAPATWVKKKYQISLFYALAIVLILVLLTAIVSSIFFRLRSDSIFSYASAKPITSLVVLPMENLSGDKSQEYFADGMTDELIASLARISSIRVLSRTTAMEYKDSHESLGKIARDLGVDAVVEGTVLRSGDRVRITAELIQVSTDRHLWADTYESPLDDVLSLQNRVASAIVEQIRIQLTSQDKTRLASRRLVKPDAYEDFLKGLFYWNKRSRDDLIKAIDYFQLAIAKDPQYALAYAGLADCYGILGAAIVGTVPTIEVAPKPKPLP